MCDTLFTSLEGQEKTSFVSPTKKLLESIEWYIERNVSDNKTGFSFDV